ADITRPDYIRQSECDPIDAAVLDVVLPSRLGNRVAAVDRIDWMIERDRLLLRLGTIAQRGLEVDQTADLELPTGLFDIGAGDATGQRVGLPIVRIFVRGGGVDHRVGAEIAYQRRQQLAIDDAVLD